ncbi:MAG TPA: hypothetical protein VGH22_15165, partial [Candidatus Binatia bacterium]
ALSSRTRFTLNVRPTISCSAASASAAKSHMKIFPPEKFQFKVPGLKFKVPLGSRNGMVFS